MSADYSQLPYRQGVGLCLFNREGLVLCAERRDRPGAWQMPQGGLHKDEAPHIAAMRELKEEVGTDHAEIIASVPEKLSYEFPDWMMHNRTPKTETADGKTVVFRGKYRGQQQIWFALKFLGSDADISLDGEHEPEAPEFIAWKWVPLAESYNLVVDFKQPVYQKVIDAFSPLAEAIRRGDKLPRWTATGA
jgi:putative (di)nucleoside polyphosphate hydrolase